MSPKVFEAFAEIVSSRYNENHSGAVLEIGASAWTLLSIPCFKSWRRVALNMVAFQEKPASLDECECVVGNSNALDFGENEFDCVMSCSVLEHDKYFWQSLDEIHRVLKPRGLFVVGVPIYMKLPTDCLNTTLTFERHGYSYNADFYRFSEQSVREVILEKFKCEDSILVRRFPNPYIVASGVKC